MQQEKGTRKKKNFYLRLKKKFIKEEQKQNLKTERLEMIYSPLRKELLIKKIL